MNRQLLLWCAITGILSAIFILHAIMHNFYGKCSNSRRRILGLGRERDIFYVPGDSDDNLSDMD